MHVHSVRKVTAVQARHKLTSSEDGRQSRILVRGYIESPEKVKSLGWPRVHPGEKVRGCRSWSQILETKLQHRSMVHPGNRSEDWHTNTTQVAQVGTEGFCLSLMGTPGPLGRRYERSEAAEGMTIGTRSVRRGFTWCLGKKKLICLHTGIVSLLMTY